MSQVIKILFAEDEPALGTIIKESLETRGFEVTWCQNGAIALESFQNENYDALVLDVMMPVKDGFSLAQEIRKSDTNIPIIFLTAKSQPKDVVKGFDVGGNDYLKKPFSMEELIVRVKNLLKTKTQPPSHLYSFGKYVFDALKQRLKHDGNEISLSHKETEILKYFIEANKELVDRSIILTSIWGNDDIYNSRSMDVYITKLRKKLIHDPDVEIINIRGFGYKMVW
ncbi:MAG: response regulator transcription factor [Reichenbachiella sp.]